ncbi:MAG: hypothetical protein NC907_06315, partial [Candidatus Omnitrophica bacterium]|nr:hypothetical protein [Candidatus Omnitrophota bacterium]
CGKQLIVPPAEVVELPGEPGAVFCSQECYKRYLLDGIISLPRIEVPWKDDEEIGLEEED